MPANPKTIRDLEGALAIYREHTGFSCVRVRKISMDDQRLEATIVLVPTPGFLNSRPPTWRFATSWDTSSFAKDRWSNPYLSVAVYFNEDLVKAVIRFCSTLPAGYSHRHYEQIATLISDLQESKSRAIECPNCLSRVIPMTDGICPSCRESTQGQADGNEGMTLLKVWQGQRLPEICFRCGKQASGRVRVSLRKRLPQNESAAEGILLGCLLNLWLGIITWILRRSQASMKVTVCLPRCGLCSSFQPVHRYYDPEEGYIQFIVHRNLREAAEGLG